MTQKGFIERHALWNDDQVRQAAELRARCTPLRLIRMAWADPHGASRAKAVTVPVFLDALKNGYNINVATTTLDGAGGRVFASFTRGGGMGLEEMTGSPNLTIVPDPSTFRVLPWAPGTGWILCDEHFNNGTPFHFSPRQILRRLLRELRGKGMALKVGLEIEWYLARITEDLLTDEHVGLPGVKGRPPRTAPVEPGYSYHSESNLDRMEPLLSTLAQTYEALGLPLRSLEKEWGPGQVESTFSAQDALQAADDVVLFRTATRQVCRRAGYLASFMTRPALKGYFASGWHLHQSLVDVRTGENLFMPKSGGEPVSALGKHYMAGLLAHAGPATAFTTPTVNGYRRFKPNSLAPDRATWAYDHRGTMIRALGGAGDPASRLENRVGEPSANPYLFAASQLIAGGDGLDRKLDPGPQDLDPYNAKRAPLPARLSDALDQLERDSLFRGRLGELFVDYFVKLKRSEEGRFSKYLQENGLAEIPAEPTAWEQNEYFDFF